MQTTSLWETLRHTPVGSGDGRPGVRAWLNQKLDLAQYRPTAVSDVVESRLEGRDGIYHILKNPEEKTYYRLSDQDYFLWERMDGTRTVKDLVVAYFLEYGSFAFSRVATLIDGLKGNLFLVDQPVQVYRKVQDQLDRRDPLRRANRLWQAFLQLEVAYRGLDRAVGALYRWGGWLLFTWPAQVLYVVTSVAGIVLFGRALTTGGFGVVTIGGSYVWGIVGLVASNLASIFVHEMAHALTVKHYGREVRRGGFLVFFGMPAFFVDTMDIWLEGKRARLAVTWAGPYSGLVLGGLASAVIVFWPAFELNALLFQFAFLSYITVFFNLMPLIELDGYFLLMDWLEIPMLRARSLAFIRSGLWAKLSESVDQGTGFKRALRSFSREERIFTVFGVLSAVWTAYAIISAGQYWQAKLASAVRDLWAQGGDVRKIAMGVVGLAISAPFVVAMGMALLGTVRTIVGWSVRRVLAASSWVVAAILVVGVAAIGLAPGSLSQPRWQQAVAMAGLAGGAFLAWRNAVRGAGSRFAPVWWLLGSFPLLLLVREGALLAAAQMSSTPTALEPIASALGHLAYLCLFLAGLRLFANTDLGELHTVEKALLALGLLVSFGLVLWVSGRPGAPLDLTDPQALLTLTSSLFPLAAATLLLPTVSAFLGTRSGPAWPMMLGALCGYVATALLGLSALLPGLLLTAAFLVNSLAYARDAALAGRFEAEGDLSDQNRLRRAFAWTVSGVFSQFRETAGARQATVLSDQVNNYAVAAGWRVSLVRGQVDETLPADIGIIERGRIYAAALTLLLDLTAAEVGERTTVRALQRSYDRLPWEEREIASQYLFRDVPRAEALGQEFRETHQSYSGLLRQMPLFATMDEAEVDLLCGRLRVERYAPGRAIVRQGDRGDRFYIVERGHVGVTQRDDRGVTDVVNQLDRGDYFGELALLRDAPRNATCRAAVPTEVLSLSREDFDDLVKGRFALREKVDQSIARADLLRRMPLFVELNSRQIRLIAAQLGEEIFEPGATIIREGEIGDTFYVIESGRARVTVSQDGEERVVAERGPGEYVGEIALLLEVPRTATVTAQTETQTLTLRKDDFERLVTAHLYVSRGLERETSRRMIDLRRVAQRA